MAEEFFYNSMHVKITYAAVRKAMKKEKVSLYKMSLVGVEAVAVEDAVNQGIDSHLEACYVPSEGDKYEHSGRMIGKKMVTKTLECLISPKSLPVLLRRLTEPDFKADDVGTSLAEGVLTTLGFDEMGKYVGSEKLGV